MMKKITVALVGRPNVGKSTLFNCLTQSRAALVADMPGLTRDRQYGEGHIGDYSFRVIDTGGLSQAELEGVSVQMAAQALQAVSEAEMVFFLVDAQKGLTPDDELIAQKLRQMGKFIVLVVNKIDGFNENLVLTDFYSLGFSLMFPIAAAHQRGVFQLIEYAFEKLPEGYSVESDEFASTFSAQAIRVALVGRPNVGKSTLLNRLLGEDRVVVFDQPGTTRDSIYVPFQRFDQDYTLIDTAGIRKKGRIDTTVEKFSIVKTLAAIDDAHVVVMLLDAQEGIVEQDLHLLGYVIEAGRALVIALNKWDGLSKEDKTTVLTGIERRLVFADFAKLYPISALHGTGVGHLYEWIDKAYESAHIKVSTSRLTALLQAAIQEHQPPMIRGRRIKLRYAHMGGSHPPTIVIHGNQTEDVPDSYQRYLMHFFCKQLDLSGTPLRIEFKSGTNPFAGRRNRLTPRQEYKKKRLIQHVKAAHKKKKKT